MAEIRLRNLTKRWGDFVAVDTVTGTSAAALRITKQIPGFDGTYVPDQASPSVHANAEIANYRNVADDLKAEWNEGRENIKRAPAAMLNVLKGLSDTQKKVLEAADKAAVSTAYFRPLSIFVGALLGTTEFVVHELFCN